MRRIARFLKTLASAEAFQSRLYARYDTVRLVEFPRFTEVGVYIWEIA